MIKWRRGPPPFLPHDVDKNIDQIQNSRERELFYRYHLGPLKDQSLRRVYADNLYLLDELEKIFSFLPLNLLNVESIENRSKPFVIDIGVRNWDYVFSLERFLKNLFPQGFELHGIEIDAFGIYKNFYSRFDYALAFIKQTNNFNLFYHPIDFLKYSSDAHKVDIIFIFYHLWGGVDGRRARVAAEFNFFSSQRVSFL
jgi:hypothetical protein